MAIPKQLMESKLITDKEWEEYQTLKKNRDKALSFIEEKLKKYEWYDTDLFYLISLLKEKGVGNGTK